jgi:hypothetical protein
LRSEQNIFRRNYNRKLFSLVKLSDEELKKLDKGSNDAGNCPEYSTWATVCTNPGEYKSLCLNIAKEQTMECCGPCAETARAAQKLESQSMIGGRRALWSVNQAKKLQIMEVTTPK